MFFNHLCRPLPKVRARIQGHSHLKPAIGFLEVPELQTDDTQIKHGWLVLGCIAVRMLHFRERHRHVARRVRRVDKSQLIVAGIQDPGALCARCGQRFASRMHIDDLSSILPQLGFDYSMGSPGGAPNWQDLCPACKRKTLSIAQMRIKEEARG